MYSLLLVLGIFVTVAAWGIIETGRKFRAEFKKRGKPWRDVVQAMQSDQPGTLIVDTLWGPQQGLGHPVIWYAPQSLPAGDELQEQVRSGAFLVRVPRKMRSLEALRRAFGETRVLNYSWQIDRQLAESSSR